MRILLARVPDGRCIDNGRKFGHIREAEPVKGGDILLLEPGEIDVLFDFFILGAQLGEAAGGMGRRVDVWADGRVQAAQGRSGRCRYTRDDRAPRETTTGDEFRRERGQRQAKRHLKENKERKGSSAP